MAKPVQKRIKMGYALFIKRNPTDKSWERVGFLFNNSQEASQYRESRLPDVTKWSVQAVRVSAQHNVIEE